MRRNRSFKTTFALGLLVSLGLAIGCGGDPSGTTGELVEGAPEGILLLVIGDGPPPWSAATEDAVEFGRHYVNAVSTEGSLRALLTGFPFEASTEGAVRPTLAELSSRMGYTTFALVDETGSVSVATSLTDGFDVVRRDLNPSDPLPQLAEQIDAIAGPYLGFLYVSAPPSTNGWLEGLRDLPRFDRTLVVLTADHGPIEESESIEARFRDRVIRVPLVVKFPAGGRPETVPPRVGSITSNIDLLPSLLALAGRDISGALPGSNVLDGYFSDGAFIGGDEAWAFVQDEHKVVVSGEKAWVFDLATDPEEQVDLAASSPELAKGLLEVAVQTREMLSRDAVAEVDEEMDEETLEHLRSLGYIQ